MGKTKQWVKKIMVSFAYLKSICLEIAYIAEVRPCLAGKAKGFVGNKLNRQVIPHPTMGG